MINAINWPIQTLAVLPAVVFIILMIAFPIIGLFAGWKRGLYWGGGTLLFYLIGLLIWRFAGVAIIAPFKDQLTQWIQEIADAPIEVTPELLASVAAPVWFLIMMIFGELVLVINYFTWFKKVAGLKKIKVKDPKTKEVVKVYPNQAQINKGHGIINKLGGFAALGLLTIPTTAAFTQTLYCTMTSPTTRSENQATQDVYKFLMSMNDGPFSWLAYSSNTIHDFDAIFSALDLYTKEITITYVDDSGKTHEVSGNIVEVIDEAIAGSVKEVMSEISETDDLVLSDLGESINEISKVWNKIEEAGGASLESLFNSENATELVGQVVNEIVEDTYTIEDDDFNALFDEETGVVTEILKEYQEYGTIGDVKIENINQIPTTQECIDNLVDVFMGKIDTTKLTDPENQIPVLEETVDGILKILFQVK